MGGCLLNENLVWGSILQTIQTHPPDPELAGERWRDLWLDRLKHTPLFPEVWLRHPSRDDYWKQGSICEDYGAIECAVYAIGGWKDAYVNAVPRLLSNLSCPRKGLIGPWAHVYPHESGANAIGFLQDTLRWWDRWLKGEDNGVMDGPMLRAWLCDRWIEEWPLATEPASHTVEPNASIRSPQTT